MDDVENLLHQAQLVSVAPALPPDAAGRALHGVRRRRQLQLGGVGGLTVAVVGGGALLASTRPDTTPGIASGGAPAPVATTAIAASSQPSPIVSTSPIVTASPPYSMTATPSAAIPAVVPATPSSGRTEAPASTPECRAVKVALPRVVGPVGYSVTSAIQPAQFSWQRGWLRSDKAHASLEVEAFCVDPKATPPQPTAETVGSVTVQGHKALLTTDFGGSFARITWSPNASTEVTVSANAFQPTAWGRTPVADLKAARLTDSQLLAFAQTVPTG